MNVVILFLAGTLSTLAFAPFSQSWLALLSLVVLFYYWLNPHRQRPVWDGFIFGIGYFGGGISWVYISLYYYGNAPLFFAVLANILLVVMMAAYFAIAGYLLRFNRKDGMLSRALSIPVIWTFIELVRAYLFTGFPWLSLGYSQLNTFLSAFAPLGGVFTVSFMFTLWAAILAYSILRKKIFLAGSFTAFLLAISLLLGQLNFIHSAGNPFSVALVQGNISQLTKFDPQQMKQDLLDYLLLAKQQKSKVVILPETAFPFMEEILAFNLLPSIQREFKARGQTLVTGILAGKMEKEEYYNAVITLGLGKGRYYKRHLLPFGEFIPFRHFLTIFEKYVSIPYSSLQAGTEKQPPFIIDGYQVGVSVCYEAAFGREIRKALPEANYLINISNDGWFKDSIAASQHLQINQMRALELGREMARATNNGMTAIIDSKGKIKKDIPRGMRAVLVGEIQPYRGLTPFARFGNTIIISILLFYLVAKLIAVQMLCHPQKKTF